MICILSENIFMKSLFFILVFIFGTNILIAQNNNVELLGCNLDILSRSYERGFRKIELEYGIFAKRYYSKSGKIKKDIIYSKNHKEVLVNFYNTKGKLKNIKAKNKNAYNICYAIKKAREINVGQRNIYIKSFELDSWEYPNSWFIGKDSVINPKLEESYGLIINKETGKETDYYTKKTFPLRNQEEKEEDLLIWYFDNKRAEFSMGNEKLRDFLKPNKDFLSNEIVHGLVAVSFGIDESGNIFDLKIVRGINEKQDNEALRLINSMPKWIPAENSDGEKIKDYFTVVVYFNKEE